MTQPPLRMTAAVRRIQRIQPVDPVERAARRRRAVGREQRVRRRLVTAAATAAAAAAALDVRAVYLAEATWARWCRPGAGGVGSGRDSAKPP